MPLLNYCRKNGHEAVMVDEICAKANVARKTFYNYYSSKDELIHSLCESLLFAEMANMVAMGIEQHETLPDRLCFVLQSIGETLSLYASLERSLLQFTLQNINFENGGAKEMKHDLDQMNNSIEYLLNQDSNISLPWSKSLLVELITGLTMSLVINWVNNESYPLQDRIDEWCLFIKSQLVVNN